jgi:hypothetical protein
MIFEGRPKREMVITSTLSGWTPVSTSSCPVMLHPVPSQRVKPMSMHSLALPSGLAGLSYIKPTSPPVGMDDE